MASIGIIRRDSRAWTIQVWVSFLIAASLCVMGLMFLPGLAIERAFMMMGYLFCMIASFVLSKFVRDNEKVESDTPMFKYVVWLGFFLAIGLTGWGLAQMEINPTYKAFLGVSWLYLITCTLTLAKALRDAHEADLIEARALRQPRTAEVTRPQNPAE